MTDKYTSLRSFLEIKQVPCVEYELDLLVANEESFDECAVKSLLLSTDFGYILAVMVLLKKLDSAKLRRRLNTQRLRFSTEEELSTVMDCVSGSCHPFGSIRGVKTIIDSSVLETSDIYCSSGVLNGVIKISLHDYIRIEDPILADISK